MPCHVVCASGLSSSPLCTRCLRESLLSGPQFPHLPCGLALPSCSSSSTGFLSLPPSWLLFSQVSSLSPVPARNNGQGWASQSWPQTQSPRAHPGLFSAVGDGVRKGFSTPSTMAALDHCPAVTRRPACPKISSLPLLLGVPTSTWLPC